MDDLHQANKTDGVELGEIRFIDLFSGIGGFRLGLERCNDDKEGFRLGLERASDNREFLQGKEKEGLQGCGTDSEGRSTRINGFRCVWSNDFNKYANQVYTTRFGEANHHSGDIRGINAEDIPDHDLLCAGFPCQAFSVAGKRHGFKDTRGTLFFEIYRILDVKRPMYLLLENVKGLLSHDGGKTFDVIIENLNNLGYIIDYRCLNSKHFGVPQNRERVFIWGINLPKLIREVAEDGDQKKQRLLLQIGEGFLLRILLNGLTEPKKQSGIKLRHLTLDSLIYREAESLGLKTTLLKYGTLAPMENGKRQRNSQENLGEACHQPPIKDTNLAYDQNRNNPTLRMTDITTSMETEGDLPSFMYLLWKSISEEDSQKKKKYITSTLLKRITESKTYTSAEIEAITLLFIGLEKEYFQNWLKTVKSALTKIKVNTFGTTQRNKENYVLLICSMVNGTDDLNKTIGHLREGCSKPIFPITEAGEYADKPRGETQGEGARVRTANTLSVGGSGRERNLIANTMSSRYYKDGSENLISVGDTGKNPQGYRVYDPEGIAQTLASQAGGLGAKMGLYAVPVESALIHSRGLETRQDGVSHCLKGGGGGSSKNMLVEPFIQNIPHGYNDGFKKPLPSLKSNSGAQYNELLVQPVLTPERLEKRQHGRRFKDQGEPMFILTGQDQHGVAISKRLITPEDIDYNDSNANASETNTRKILRILWETLDSESREGWRFGESPAFLTEEVLQQRMYEAIIQGKVEGEPISSRGKLQSETVNPSLPMRELWLNLKPRYSPQRQEQVEQLFGELTDSLPRMSYKTTLAREQESERDVQVQNEGQPRSFHIRRLTPCECERLQGFPDGWTETGIQDGKQVKVSDSQRYKMLGNAVTVPVIRFLGDKLKEALN